MAVRLCGGHGPLWYRMTGTPPGLAAAVGWPVPRCAGSGPQSRPRRSSRLPPPLRTSRSPAAQTRYTVPGRCSLLWRGTAGGGRAAGRDRSTQGQAGAAASCSLRLSGRLSRLPLGSGTGWRGRGAGSRRVRESVRFLRFVCGIELWIPGVDVLCVYLRRTSVFKNRP